MRINKNEKNVPVAWIFDADGVLIDPVKKIKTVEQLTHLVIDMVHRGEPFIINSGRSTQWVYDNFVAELETLIEDKSLLSNILIIGEKGNSWSEYKAGEWTTEFDNSVIVPDILRKRIDQLIKEEPFRKLVYRGEDSMKKTMVSPEMITGANHEEYTHIQAELVSRMRILLKELNLDTVFRVESTAIAVDIEPIGAGKGKGARRAVELLRKLRIKPKHFEAVGDSPSDKEMADALHEMNFSVQFIFVGNKDEVKKLNIQDTPYPIIITKEENEQGALEHIRRRATEIDKL